MLYLPGRPGPRDRRLAVRADQVDAVRRLLETAESRGKPVLLPTDVVVARESTRTPKTPDRALGRDRGRLEGPGHRPGDGQGFAAAVAAAAAHLVFWNGPMGVFELAPFAAGTKAVAEDRGRRRRRSSAGRHRRPGRLGLADRVDHLSTGGGASLPSC